MSDIINDKTLAEYLQRGSEFSQQYKHIACDDVPPTLDSLVMSHAQQSLSSGTSKHRKRLRQWSAPLAVAATLVIAVSIVIESNTQQDSLTPLRTVAAPAPSASSTIAPNAKKESSFAAETTKIAAPSASGTINEPSGKPKAQEKSTAADKLNSATVSARLRPEVVPLVVTPLSSNTRNSPVSAPPTKASATADSAALVSSPIQENAARSAPRDRMERRDASVTELQEAIVTAQEHTVADQRLSQRSREAHPKLWLQYIRQLRSDAQSAKADAEWQRFKRAYPQYPVAEQDSARGGQ